MTPAKVIAIDAKKLNKEIEKDCDFGFKTMSKIAQTISHRLSDTRFQLMNQMMLLSNLRIMAQKILIDMIKLRSAMVENPDYRTAGGLFLCNPVILNGFKSIRELATFRFTCRKCEDAPCIAVCPADALEKDGDGIITVIQTFVFHVNRVSLSVHSVQ